MAKLSKTGGTSKFRMVVIDAELQEGEITQLVHAIQGAFGSQRAPTVRLSGGAIKSLPTSNAVEGSGELESDEIIEPVEEQLATPAVPKPKAQRKSRTPNLDNDLHPEAESSFKTYAETRAVTNSAPLMKKFLVIAAWLHEERKETPITADRAYTCFRFINWSFNIDYDQPLRDLKRKHFIEQKPENKGKGEFSITGLGLANASKLKVSSD